MNELSTVEATTAPAAFNAAAVFSDPARLQSLMAFADVMAKSAVTVPKHLAGKPSDCLAITLQALRWGMDPYVVAQKTHLVNGNLGYEAQLVVAVLKSSGAVRSRPYYEWVGDGNAMACRAGFIPAGETEIVWTEWLRVSDIQVKNSPLWKTNPRQQMGYLQARNWARLYAPEALLGVYTADELEVLPATDQPRGDLPPVDEVPPRTGPRRKGSASQSTTPAADSVDPSTGEIGKQTDLLLKGEPEQSPQGSTQTHQAGAGTQAHTGGAANSSSITANQVAYLRNKLRAAGSEEAPVLERFGVTALEQLTAGEFDTLKAELLQMV